MGLKLRSTSLKTATTATGSVALKIAPKRRHSTQDQSYGKVYFTSTAVRLALKRVPGPEMQMHFSDDVQKL